MADSGNHFVYLYRDWNGQARYVGYGASSARATSHLKGTHNPKLELLLQKGRFTIEIAGPFDSEATGRAVETALISALGPGLVNIDLGPSVSRLRPLGVPAEYAERQALSPLDQATLWPSIEQPPAPMLFVRINNKDFLDGRRGYDPARPPTNEQIRERVEKWWQLRSYLPDWTAHPERSPGLLLGIHGTPGVQLIIAALRIDQHRWGSAKPHPEGRGKLCVPVERSANLDVCGLRGRYLDRSLGIAFESVSAGFYCILYPDGHRVGGRRPRSK